MRLARLVAEYFYLKDTDNNSKIPFDDQDSNVKDFYFRMAYDKLPEYLAGYFKDNGQIAKIIRGSILSFTNAHGVTLNKDNYNSLSKRIISSVRNLKPRPQNYHDKPTQ